MIDRTLLLVIISQTDDVVYLCRLFSCMYKESNTFRMSVSEVHRRLRAVKRELLNKNQVLFFSGDERQRFDRLDIDLPDESFFYSGFDRDSCSRLIDQKFTESCKNNKRIVDRANYIPCDLLTYVSMHKGTLTRSLAITAMLFTKYRCPSIVRKLVFVCTGSVYHAPRIFYKDMLSGNVVYTKCSDYSDLM